MSTLPSLAARWVLALAVIAGCRSNHAPSTTASSAASRPTAQPTLPPLSPELMPLFEKLVKLDSIDASSVSDGEPGEFYGLWLEFSKLAGPSDFERLALDPQPLARAMGWLGLARQSNERSTGLIVAHVHDREP